MTYETLQNQIHHILAGGFLKTCLHIFFKFRHYRVLKKLQQGIIAHSEVTTMRRSSHSFK